MILFPLIFLTSFLVALKDVLMGNRTAVFTFIIFGLSLYTTAMSVMFVSGFAHIIPVFQYFKEILIFSALILNIASLRHRPRFHLIDYLVLAYLGYLILYAILPIGEQSFATRMLSLKSMGFFMVVYFTGRLIDPKNIEISKYFNYLMILTIAAGVLVLIEAALNWHLQSSIGYADYTYYFLNAEVDETGLPPNFMSDGGYPRYASFFFNPLEFANATLLALAVITALFTRDDNKLSINSFGVVGFVCSLLCIVFAFSRGPLVSYLLMIYVYALVTKRRYITNTIYAGLGAGVIYVVYLFVRFQNTDSGIMALVMNTIDFSNPSSIGHIEQWAEGILAIQEHPLGMGLGSSGVVAAISSKNTGGENQFIIIAVQAGLFAMALYLSIMVLFIKTTIKWLPHLKGRERKLCMAVLLLKIGYIIPLLVSELESSPYLSYMNWFLSGLLISMIMRPRTDVEEVVAQVDQPVYA